MMTPFPTLLSFFLIGSAAGQFFYHVPMPLPYFFPQMVPIFMPRDFMVPSPLWFNDMNKAINNMNKAIKPIPVSVSSAGSGSSTHPETYVKEYTDK
ncbi:hypothetical protein Q1695_002518 [Nippostrongylus brasiliensis]|nr:hypothetical protein Q1695_002518 [Nippostrongylus brasiliensis]